MPRQEGGYCMCDFCHTPHPTQELEKIKITYKKCSDCEVILTPASPRKEGSFVVQPQTQSAQIPSEELKKMNATPPRHMASAFQPPVDQQI